MASRIPSYRLHRPSGQAVVTIARRDHYLGSHGTPESRTEYDRLIAEWLASGRTDPPEGEGITVGGLLLDFLRWADSYYRKGGAPTGEAANIRLGVRPLRALYGHTAARDFGPLALKTIRTAMVANGLSRKEVNRRVRYCVRVFAWGVENELVPSSVHHGLQAVASLKKDRSPAPETEPVGPVPEADVAAVEPHVARQVWAMVELQLLTGMRPGEAASIRTGDLDRSGPVWTYTPCRHKTEHHGRARPIWLGPKAQAVLRAWLRADPGAYLFSPAEAVAARRAAQRAVRVSKVPPSQRDRSRPDARRTAGDRYSTRTYCHAVKYGCDRAGVPHWHPNQLRHNAATRIRKDFGLETARVILGHVSPAVTAIYAEADHARACQIMGEIG